MIDDGGVFVRLKNRGYIVYVVIISIFLADIIMYAGLIKIFFNGNETIIAGVIAFVGAVIGGALTLIGVQYTIQIQRKKDRLEKLPELIINSWKIHKELAYPLVVRQVHGDVPLMLMENFYKDNDEWVTELSTKVSSEMYSLVNSFFTHVSDYNVFEKRGNLKEWYEKTENFYKLSGDIVDAFEKEYKELEFSKEL